MTPARARSGPVGVLASIALATAVSVAACASQFEASHRLDSVRILGARADKPYAKPGERVNVELLAFDARREQPEPMQVFWIPIVCVNPPQDLYYACFLPLAGAPDGGADGASSPDAARPPDAGIPPSLGDFASRLQPGQDLSAFLARGPRFSFVMPPDAVSTHKRVQGRDEEYGLAILFNIACAGRPVFAGFDATKGPQQVPIQCVDRDGNPVRPEDYVFGLTRVYAYNTKTNANPVLERVTFDGVPIDPRSPVIVERCPEKDRMKCKDYKFDVEVPPASWELNPPEIDANGNTLHEQVWASYYTTMGDFEGDARLVYDVRQGRVAGSEMKFKAPVEAQEGTMFVVLRDTRGGAAWQQIRIKSE